MTMEKYLDKASEVVDRMSYMPKILLKGCAGLILLEATEVGLIISGTSGAGVLISHRSKEREWSNPVAVNLKGLGVGAVIGGARKDVVVALNHLALDRFLEGSFELKLGEDIGFAVGPAGGAAGADIGVTAENFGWATSFVYTSQNGALINVEVMGTGISVDHSANLAFYGTHNIKDILEGKAQVPEGTAGSKVPALQEKIHKWCCYDEKEGE